MPSVNRYASRVTNGPNRARSSTSHPSGTSTGDRSVVVLTAGSVTGKPPMLRAMPLQTERLLLRDLEPDDLDALAAMFADEEVMRWIGAGGVLGRDVAAGMIERQQRHYLERGWGQWATVERASGRMIGVCGLILWPAIGGREELEVAYLLARDAWGKGFATEAALAIRDYGVGSGRTSCR